VVRPISSLKNLNGDPYLNWFLLSIKNNKKTEATMKRILLPACLIILIALTTGNALAQTYLFQLEQLTADVYINSNGSVSLEYQFKFTNNPTASPIDYVDVGMPNSDFSLSGASAQVDGTTIALSRSDYEGSGSGFAAVLGSSAIRPGQTGVVHVVIPNAGSWLHYDSQSKDYASFVFAPTWFGSQYVTGSTNTQVTFHLPPEVQPDEPRWHSAPSGFPSEPETGFDDQGRITYTWKNPNASGSREYDFGASFPAKYVPASAITRPSIFEMLGISSDTFFTFLCCGGIFAGIVGIGWWSNEASRRRKLQYLPPKIAIEGMGIKRGLTAVEAAILMEQPLDKVMTMMLFGVLKKGAASVKTRDPLQLKVNTPIPEGLNSYEKDFLEAFKKSASLDRRKALQTMTIDLVKSVSEKMKGFSRKETVAYYKNIIDRAWTQVETAQTPEVKSETYDKYLEWTMLDKDYDDRTRDVFHTGPVFIPTWWGRYDPTYHGPTTTSKPLAAPLPAGSAGGGGGISLPTLPGGTFAASIVNGVQNFSAGVIGNVTDFTNSITNKTNPVPVTTSTHSSSSSRSGGGCACACACACAGCACACAGGGR
jgi:hypothetical protein